MPIENVDHRALAAAASGEEPQKKTRGRSRYLRKALVRLGIMPREMFKAHTPKNMFEASAKMLYEMSLTKGPHACVAFKLIRETLGENMPPAASGSEEKQNGGVQVVDGMPRPVRKPQ